MAAPLYKQCDLVILKDPQILPDGREFYHPYLIISTDVSNSIENSYVLIMMTSSIYPDRYSYSCSDNMFENPLAKTGCNFRMHLITHLREDQIKQKVNRMLPIHVKALLKEVISRTLSL